MKKNSWNVNTISKKSFRSLMYKQFQVRMENKMSLQLKHTVLFGITTYVELIAIKCMEN